VRASCTGISPHRTAKVYRIGPKSEWKGADPCRGPLRIPTSGFTTLGLHLCRALSFVKTFPVDNVSTESIEHRDQEEECPTSVDVADVNMPFLVVFRWLNEACALLAGGGVLAIQPSSSFQNAISGTWADSDGVVVKHHECQSSVTFQWVFVVEVKNRLFLPLLEPTITRYFAIVTETL